MNYMKRMISVLLTLVMVLTMSASVLAADGMQAPPDAPPEGDMGAMEAGMAQTGGGGGAPKMGGVPEQAALYFVENGEDQEKEYDADLYKDNWSFEDGFIVVHDLDLTNGDYGFNGIAATDNTKIKINNSKIHLSVDTPCGEDDEAGSATAIGSGSMMFINGSELTVDGAGRYVTSAYNDSKLIVNDSKVVSTGNNANTDAIAAPRSNGALLISGNARANFSIGATQTYYYNSECIAEGWAALSTDSATGTGLDLYAYGTKAIAQNGGYSTYADTNCRVWLYGSDLEAAEIGAIISKNGRLTADTAENATAEALEYYEGQPNAGGTVLAGGRNAVMMHAPDMGGSGKGAASTAELHVFNSTLKTTKDLVSTEDYYGTYGNAIGAYIDYVSGADLLVRSTSANIELDNVNMETYSGVLLLTALNADSMGNFLKNEEDGELVDPISIKMSNMTTTGDIRHMDYQRRMVVDLENEEFNGDIIGGTFADWASLWSSYGEEASNWLPDTEWNTIYGVALTMGGNSVWNVGEVSNLSSLTVNDGATINGHVYVNGKETKVSTGKTYTGAIVVSAGEMTKEDLAAYSNGAKDYTLLISVLAVAAGVLAALLIIKVKKKK